MCIRDSNSRRRGHGRGSRSHLASYGVKPRDLAGGRYLGRHAGGTQPSGPGFGPKSYMPYGLVALLPGGGSPHVPAVSVSHP
eukprot:4375364-Alexandrium_andersonii.AAC.1